MSQRPREDRPVIRVVPVEKDPGTPLDRALLDWRGAQQRVTAYLGALGLRAEETKQLARQVLERALGRSSQRSTTRRRSRLLEHNIYLLFGHHCAS